MAAENAGNGGSGIRGIPVPVRDLRGMQQPGATENLWRGTLSWFEYELGRRPDESMNNVLSTMEVIAHGTVNSRPQGAHLPRPPVPMHRFQDAWPEKLHLIMSCKSPHELMPSCLAPGDTRQVMVDILNSPATRALSRMLTEEHKTAVIFTNVRDSLRPEDINGSFLLDERLSGYGVIILTHGCTLDMPIVSRLRGMVISMPVFRRFCAPFMLPEFSRMMTPFTGCVVRGVEPPAPPVDDRVLVQRLLIPPGDERARLIQRVLDPEPAPIRLQPGSRRGRGRIPAPILLPPVPVMPPLPEGVGAAAPCNGNIHMPPIVRRPPPPILNMEENEGVRLVHVNDNDPPPDNIMEFREFVVDMIHEGFPPSPPPAHQPQFRIIPVNIRIPPPIVRRRGLVADPRFAGLRRYLNAIRPMNAANDESARNSGIDLSGKPPEWGYLDTLEEMEERGD